MKRGMIRQRWLKQYTKYEAFAPYLNEQTRRVWAAIESTDLGQGNYAVSVATGLK